VATAAAAAGAGAWAAASKSDSAQGSARILDLSPRDSMTGDCPRRRARHEQETHWFDPRMILLW